MRLCASFTLESPLLPKDYRRGFLSLLKSALQNSNPQLYEEYYSTRHVLKPFTFSVYFPELAGQQDEHFNVGHRGILNFSTSSYELGTYLYNGLLKLRDFALFANRLTVTHIDLRRPVEVSQDSVVFKTISPILINSRGNPDWYLLPGQEGFDEGVHFAVKQVVRTFLNTDVEPITFKPINIKRKVVKHYNMDMQGVTGLFELCSEPKVLNLIYQIGLGVRRSQGFGMLEIVR
jgi:CRISPR-associated endoribonuclease Cas6